MIGIRFCPVSAARARGIVAGRAKCPKLFGTRFARLGKEGDRPERSDPFSRSPSAEPCFPKCDSPQRRSAGGFAEKPKEISSGKHIHGVAPVRYCPQFRPVDLACPLGKEPSAQVAFRAPVRSQEWPDVLHAKSTPSGSGVGPPARPGALQESIRRCNPQRANGLQPGREDPCEKSHSRKPSRCCVGRHNHGRD
jgi:hypothetical protein